MILTFTTFHKTLALILSFIEFGLIDFLCCFTLGSCLFDFNIF
ncbi:putative membrane protein [Helicobacter pylori CPY6261]|nr:putative membrane protein [Helicobacter pylori CPY6261]